MQQDSLKVECLFCTILLMSSFFNQNWDLPIIAPLNHSGTAAVCLFLSSMFKWALGEENLYVENIQRMWVKFCIQNHFPITCINLDFKCKLGQLLSAYQSNSSFRMHDISLLSLDIPSEYRNPGWTLYRRGKLLNLGFRKSSHIALYYQIRERTYKPNEANLEVLKKKERIVQYGTLLSKSPQQETEEFQRNEDYLFLHQKDFPSFESSVQENPPASRKYTPLSLKYPSALKEYPLASREYLSASREYLPASRKYPPASRDYPLAFREYLPASREYPPAS